MSRNNRHTYWTCFAATMFLSIAVDVRAQSSDSDPVNRPLFGHDSIIAVTIEGPLTTIMRKRDESEEHPSIFRYTDADGTQHTFDINLSIRGKFRAKKEVCNFAPLRVNFKKAQLESTLFEGQDKLKLVTDCQSKKKSYQQILLNEYLAYKILNILSDQSFGARLLRATYVNTDRKNESRDSYAFFIEEQDHIADRLGLERLKIAKTKYDDLDAAQSNFINVYQYFIANTDFSLIAGPEGSNCCHNSVLYQKDGGPIISIPYDFDHAGLIDAPYAEPNPRFKIRNVKQRIYRGRCNNNARLEATFQHFFAKRDDINELVTGLEGFDEKSVRETMKFIDDFYEDISTPKNIDQNFIKKCS